MASVLSLMTSAVGAQLASTLPPGFVYLRSVDSTIVQDIRYASSINFTGVRVPGYDAPECILLREAADALKQIQDELRDRYLSLKVYDCYRPQRAVQAFVDWVKNPNGKGVKRFYPNVARRDLISFGYIAAASAHAKGAAVDLTLVPLPRKPVAVIEPGATYGPCFAPKAEREPDESLDMGTTFDCFDHLSRNPAIAASIATIVTQGAANPHPSIKGVAKQADTTTDPAKVDIAPLDITAEQRALRTTLNEIMTKHGFRGISAEWWHFGYFGIKHPLQSLDFPIVLDGDAPR